MYNKYINKIMNQKSIIVILVIVVVILIGAIAYFTTINKSSQIKPVDETAINQQGDQSV
jgi:flagellar basal body-associated protein FliL